MITALFGPVLVALALQAAAPDADAEAVSADEEILEHAQVPWTGDLDGITKRGFLRILTVHTPLFFSYEGIEQRGIAYDAAREFEKHLAKKIGRVKSPTVVLIPVARDELIPGLVAGRGDIAMANLTITPERRKRVDFGSPLWEDVKELVISSPAAGVSTFDDLTRTGLTLRKSSSYFEHMQALNRARRKAGKKPIPISEADEYLEDYDLLDMMGAGVIDAIVMDSHKAAYWKQIFEGIVVHEDLVVHSGSQIAWAVRKNSPQLLEAVNSFAKSARKGTTLGNTVIQRYTGSAQRMKNVLAREDRGRFERMMTIIKRYSDQYEFDWLIIAAQAYQESGFDQSRVSPAGAVGVMQLLPTTAADPAVGIPDISTVENNVHAGVKYLRWLRENYYSDEAIPPLDRVLFSFAAYNAGPGNMNKARKRAEKLGFDPDRWFGNVEIGMYRAVSGEPAAYVRNIYKYYVTYRGLEQARERREEALGSGG